MIQSPETSLLTKVKVGLGFTLALTGATLAGANNANEAGSPGQAETVVTPESPPTEFALGGVAVEDVVLFEIETSNVEAQVGPRFNPNYVAPKSAPKSKKLPEAAPSIEFMASAITLPALPPIEVEEPPPLPAAANPAAPTDEAFDQLAGCESSGDWHINSGNEFYGGLQFVQSTWEQYGGLEYAERADLATREQQIEIARRVFLAEGWEPWPGCAQEFGWIN